ncbi:DNA methyltransferase [Crossiella sp. CA198]|uniref:DNA methyltransferase n=1 Tax=Crossiella sp. CA198 TaxID=3455607 RepID=UPI003F8D6BF2
MTLSREVISDMYASSLLQTVRLRELDRHSIDQKKLDVVARNRTNALPWRGQFTPGLPAAILDAFSPEGVVLDPFVGSGTTLAEVMRMGLPGCGAEINPAAISLASVYELAAEDYDGREQAIKQAERAIHDAAIQSADGLLSLGVEPHEAILQAVSELKQDGPSKLVVATLMLAMGNGKSTTADRLLKSWMQVRALVESFPTQSVPIKVVASDARILPMGAGSVGMVLTSPPYINVFNYHQNYRPIMEMLGWEVLPAARSEIGSNRKNRGNRFITVVQYCVDMAEVIDEIARVTSPGAPIVFVVGRESRVRGVSFPNGELLAGLVEASPDVTFERWQERSFTSRFGERIYEEILTFRRKDVQYVQDAIPVDTARELGATVLREAATRGASEEIQGQLLDAIQLADRVQRSPPLDLRRI